MKRINIFTNTHPAILFVIGLILLAVGGFMFALSFYVPTPIALFVLILGATYFLQASPAFRLNHDVKLLLVILLSAALVILIDFWPIQLIYTAGIVTVLNFLNIYNIFYAIPYFGGAHIFLFVIEAGTSRFVGGQIDNACAGLIALIPLIFLLFLADKDLRPKPRRTIVGILASCIIIFGNFFRLFIELWAPAVGLAPFQIVHYPLAFGLGILGLAASIIAGQYLVKSENP